MKKWLYISLVVLLFMGSEQVGAKKIKNSFKIEKESTLKSSKKVLPEGERIDLTDSINSPGPGCKFSGYDKEVSSGMESFILTNPGEKTITGFQARIDYLDMKGRMLHSRIVEERCYVPPGESRRIDIKSWDPQHMYYYYLGNEPRRVATPFKVEIRPEALWVEKPE